jgi:hypothetical protein
MAERCRGPIFPRVNRPGWRRVYLVRKWTWYDLYEVLLPSGGAIRPVIDPGPGDLSLVYVDLAGINAVLRRLAAVHDA